MSRRMSIYAEVKENGKWISLDKEIFTDKANHIFNVNRNIEGFLGVYNNKFKEYPNFIDGFPDDSEWLNTPLDRPVNNSVYLYSTKDAFTIGEDITTDQMNRGYFSHIYLKELLEFNYNNLCDDIDTYKDLLPDLFFKHLKELEVMNKDIRLIYWMD